ncbi:MAG: molybdate transport system substrate-binding protein [Bradyrhizobium sp.]|jgi:molybdate transport system substrate-binding protein|nr:molybdate transport system substrate-binding protein [Bradyrhizobium sp.]
MSALRILSGGAAQGLVAGVTPRFKATTGLDIEGEFGAVGVMAGKLRDGAPADLVVLTASIIADLVRENLVAGSSVANIGRVETALAIRVGDPPVVARDAETLRAAFLGADAIFVPDTKTSTAGIHVATVLLKLGIADQVADRLRIFPNGATAMRNMAACSGKWPIGCTQSTEIISTDGVMLSGSLPEGYDLATVYTAAITTRADKAEAARVLIGLLAGVEQRELRSRAGFLEV